MKFSRYLQDAQTPEWNRAYIDYEGLRAELRTIRGRSSLHADTLDHQSISILDIREKHNEFEETHQPRGRKTPIYSTGCVSKMDPETNATTLAAPAKAITTKQKRTPFISSLPRFPLCATKISKQIPPLSQMQTSLSECSVGLPLHRIHSNLPTYHVKFFDMLDAELAKVEMFYIEREEEMYGRASALREQLDQLEVHHKMFHESPKAPFKYLNTLPTLWFGRKTHALHPCMYPCAKMRIRGAIEEHYRCLKVLNNYRLLNLTGLRKVLKKYRKITKVSVLDTYMKEKVEPSSFGSGALVTAMAKQTERLFAEHFESGNRKKAISHLRNGQLSKTYHFITLCSGLWLGSAFPAIAGGSYLSFQESTRSSLPSWNILLFIYSILVVPVLLALLIGFDVFIWTRKRVNYAFILQFNTRSRLDHRAYSELPSFLLCTLAYAFWFSLAQIGHPMLWPLIWLVLAIVVMFNPIESLMQGYARWWTIKNVAHLVASVMQGVKFVDVWLGDQMCSLVYSCSNLYFLGCFYTRFASVGFPSLISSAYDLHAQEAWSTCSMSQNLQWYCLLGALPFAIRLLQCLRQYYDSKLPKHLMNAMKYTMGMVQYSCYCYWRYHGGPRTGPSYLLMCFTATMNSIYACAWDFLMDWAMLEPHAQYPLLRPELVYKSHIPCYYFALLSNLCIRFTWVMYIFSDEIHYNQHTFIAALLEILRRVQWNIYRLENAHIDNTRHFRITRDVPLPYSIDVQVHSDEKPMV